MNYNKYRKWRNHKVVCLENDIKTHQTRQSFTDVFFVGYFCLLIITTKAIIKANVMIVTPIKEKNNMYIVVINACISTIRLTSSCRRQTTSAYSHFLCQSFYNMIFTLSIFFIIFRHFFYITSIYKIISIA